MGPDISYCAFKLISIFVQLLSHSHETSAQCATRAIIPEIFLTTSKNLIVERVGREYIVPEDVEKFVLNCSYIQPIDWKFEGVMANTLVSVERGQTYKKLFKWKDGCFYVALIFNGVQDQITGNYKCFSRFNEKEAKIVRVFSGNGVEGKPSLIIRGKTLNITAKLRESVVNFPCGVNNPKAAVQLHFKRENEQTWEEIPLGRTVQYNPTMGYKIRVGSGFRWGLYKCSIRGDSMEDNEKDVLIYLKKPLEFLAIPSQGNNSSDLTIPANSANVSSPYKLTCRSLFPVTIAVLESNTLQVDPEIIRSHNVSMPYPYEASILLKYNGVGEPATTVGKVQCLNNGTNEVLHTWSFKWTSPSPIGLELDKVKIAATCYSAFLGDTEMTSITCETLTECQFKSKCLEDDAMNTCAHNNGTFRKLKTHELGETTAVGLLPQRSGAVRCHSPDVESTKLYFMSSIGLGIAEDVKSVDDINRIEVSITKLEVGDKITIECWLVARAFGAGPILTFEWKDASVTQVTQEQIFNSTRRTEEGFLYLNATVQILSTEVSKLSCLGIYPDEIGSWRRNKNLIVEARRRVIEGDLEEVVVFSDGNPGNLTCSAMTFPLPRITWKTPPKAKPFVKFHEEDKEMRRTSKLIFTKYDQTLDGDFVCVVVDGNRTIEKKFTVNFEASDSPGNTIGIIIGVLLLLLLVGIGIAIGFRHWKRQIPMTTPLTQKDIDEFLKGNQSAIAGSKDPYVIIQNSPYDTNYDIPKEQLELDQNKILGSGAYGMVMKGRVKGGAVEEARAVAVKTVKPNAEPAYIKSLLTELKVMIYVGKNNHVVELIGACTQCLADKQLYVVLQLCPNGGLDSYLRDRRDVFVNQVERGRWVSSKIEQMYVNTTEGTLYTADLIRWSHQIASGMEYLASKKVIHGDLATRNVLLDETLVAKISDFGLARQMYEYAQYTKKQQAPLPWRWMSIESLRDMIFSTESDVWSFGITLWEIMTLAEVPYPGLTWNHQFITTLVEGYRMSKPNFAPSEMYDIMLHCWRERPTDRITFTMLKDRLLEILETQFRAEYINL